MAPTARQAVYGLPSKGSPYSAIVRATPGLVTYWPGNLGAGTTSGSNFTMPAAFTMECWVKITSLAANRGIFSNWAGGNGAMLWVDASNTRFKFHVNSSDVDSGVAPPAAFCYLAATYDGTSRAIYVNGTLSGGPTSGVTPSASSTPLLVGNYASSGVSDLVGVVADGAIYSRPLNPGEITQHYIAGTRT